MNNEPQVLRTGLLSTQVCVPNDWTDDEVEQFVGPSGTEHGWKVRKEGDEALAGAPERNPCQDRAGFVHIMLDC